MCFLEGEGGRGGKMLHHTNKLYISINKFILAEWISRRAFFENFAKDQGFSPLVAKNWYSPRWKDKVMALPVCFPCFSLILFGFFLF
jgi:hypothetical protein